jgi:hypothetical protein
VKRFRNVSGHIWNSSVWRPSKRKMLNLGCISSRLEIITIFTIGSSLSNHKKYLETI